AASRQFQSIFFNLSEASHIALGKEIESHISFDMPIAERAHWNEIRTALFDKEELRYLLSEHSTLVWRYASNITPLVMDLIAPFPDTSPDWTDNTSVVFSVGPYYPKFPEHRRNSEVAAMVITKFTDLLRLEENGNLKRTMDWSAKCKNDHSRGVHVDYPGLPAEELATLESRYLELREELATDKRVRPVNIQSVEQPIVYARTSGVSRHVLLDLLRTYGEENTCRLLEYCVRHKLVGDAAILEQLQAILKRTPTGDNPGN
ncbi:MAG: hypothetical protein KDD60_07285, partial [Bdellovibrionales bacterium]|nr:hypothetical protein [Bdellovibrionales bacterium]